MSAQRAYDLGMISEVLEHDKLLERAHEIADIINSNAPLAVRGTRLTIPRRWTCRCTRPRSSPSVPRARSCAPRTPRRAEGFMESAPELAVPMTAFETICSTWTHQSRRDESR